MQHFIKIAQQSEQDRLLEGQEDYQEGYDEGFDEGCEKGLRDLLDSVSAKRAGLLRIKRLWSA